MNKIVVIVILVLSILSITVFYFFKSYYKPIDTFKVSNDSIEGKNLFSHYCTSCHKENTAMLIGPGLANATSKHSITWLIKWTNNCDSLIKSGDSEAVKTRFEFNGAMQPKFNFSNKQIKAIYKYIDDYNKSLNL